MTLMIPDWLADLWPHLTATFTVIVSIVAAAHAILDKREPRAAIGWVGLIVFVPLFGALFYYLFGINRISRRAKVLMSTRPRVRSSPKGVDPVSLQETLQPKHAYLQRLANLTDVVTHRPLVGGNHIRVLVNGEEAYPPMLDAIRNAKRSITLCTYIFDNDYAGDMFIDALADAAARGVEVRVLVDAAGLRYSFPSAFGKLRRKGIRIAKFLPTLVPGSLHYVNLRNHRKALIADGKLGFTGGMNIRHGHMVEHASKNLVRDLQFEVSGPVVEQLQEAFAEDWAFVTGEFLEGKPWFDADFDCGATFARAVTDGPDEDFECMSWTLLGALACARNHIRILTPYFLPDASILTALGVAAMRGVRVQIVMPENNNLKAVKWASFPYFEPLLDHGVELYFSTGTFDHSKIFLVDEFWSLIGSTNWDPRSLRLNFELNLECYGRGFADELDEVYEEKLATSRRITKAEMAGRSLPVRLRDGVAHLFSPYL